MADRSQSPHRRPTHRVYQVTGEGKNASWLGIGVVWPNKDGAE